jgi:hypothetical protein
MSNRFGRLLPSSISQSTQKMRKSGRPILLLIFLQAATKIANVQ